MVLSAGPGRPWPVSGNSACILLPSVTGPSDPDTTEAKTVAIGIADTGRTDMDLTEFEVGGPDPAPPDAGLEDTDSSDAGSTCVEHADDGSAASQAAAIFSTMPLMYSVGSQAVLGLLFFRAALCSSS